MRKGCEKHRKNTMEGINKGRVWVIIILEITESLFVYCLELSGAEKDIDGIE